MSVEEKNIKSKVSSKSTDDAVKAKSTKSSTSSRSTKSIEDSESSKSIVGKAVKAETPVVVAKDEVKESLASIVGKPAKVQSPAESKVTPEKITTSSVMSATKVAPTPAPIRMVTAPVRVNAPAVRRPLVTQRPQPTSPSTSLRVKPPGQTEVIGGRTVWRSSASAAIGFAGEVDGRVLPDAGVPTEDVTGFLDMMRDGNGILRRSYGQGENDAYISGTQIRRFGLRPGDVVTGPARKPKDNEQYWGLLKVESVNGKTPEEMASRVKFNSLTPVFPDKKLVLETEPQILSTRLIDMVAPVGLGQRGMIVSPPKAGKTSIIKEIATGVAKNYPDVFLMAVLIGERPEEVTDIRRHISAETGGKGEVAASNFDEPAEEQTRIAELALERAKRLVETGQDVVIVLDSITRLARAYNLAIPTSGRTLSGGFDPAALYPPKKFFGAARNFEPFDTPDGKKRHGSLTILGTALTDTGSKMDDLIYEEFKGTGNMELHLDRILAERRIYPAIDVQRSGTRREDLLFSQNEYQSVILMRRMNDILDPKERTQVLVNKLKQTKSNQEFLATLKEG